jgi:hypothetical protein
MLVLTGSPRVVDNGMTTTAQTIRMNRATGDAIAEGNVKSTYSDLKAQPDGAMLASSDPIHVTSRSMTAHQFPGDCGVHRRCPLVARRERSGGSHASI